MELTPIMTGTDKKTGAADQVIADEHPRPETTPEQLAKLRPAFAKNGTVTAGNASGLNDGAAALLVASEPAMKEFGLSPESSLRDRRGRWRRAELHGPRPGAGEQEGLGARRVDRVEDRLAELNEAFAAQALPCIDQLGLDPERVNINGGAIAWGHPLGASGARLVLTAMVELHQRSASPCTRVDVHRGRPGHLGHPRAHVIVEAHRGTVRYRSVGGCRVAHEHSVGART